MKTKPAKAKNSGMKKTHIRPSWDEYFMNIAEMVGTRATCDRGRTGCVITKNNRILSTGYVGSPSGVRHCDEIGHEMHTVIHEDGSKTQHCIRTTHAEQNVIAQAARAGIALEGGTLYTHMMPCYVCAKMLITAGIKRIVAKKDYHAAIQSKKVFKEAGVEVVLLSEDMEEYENM
jgi:dCMP deaminase